MKPILKYPGGKRLEIKYFAELIPPFETYIEPFLGGGAVFFYLEPPKAIINDINPQLMRFYREVAENYSHIALELNELYGIWKNNQQKFIKKITFPDPNESFYYELREMFNGKKESPYSYATLYYALNKLSFSAVRYNKKGENNVPYGHRLSFSQTLTEEHSDLLSTSKRSNQDYAEVFKQAKQKDFLFLDPPYDTRFTQYGNLVDFKEDEQLRLAEDFKNLGSKSLMIVGSTPLIDELYRGKIYSSYEKRYAQNFGVQKGKPAKHLIVSNYLRGGNA